MKNEIDLSIIIVSYNTQEYTLACLKSVYLETSAISFEIILLDNASKDNTAAAVSKQFPDVNLIDAKENYGFARGNNIAIREARGEYILLLNPDTVVRDRAIEKLYTFAKSNPKAGIYGGRTVFQDGSLNRSCYSKMTLWSLICSVCGLTKIFSSSLIFNPIPYGNWNYDTVRSVDIIEGCFLMLRNELWNKLQGFNPLFFMYAEEVDLCLRAQLLGFKPMFFPESEIIHYSGASEQIKSDRIIKTYCGEITLMKEHWTNTGFYIGRSLFLLRAKLKSLLWSVSAVFKKKDYGHAASTWKEVWQRRNEWKDGWYDIGV